MSDFTKEAILNNEDLKLFRLFVTKDKEDILDVGDGYNALELDVLFNSKIPKEEKENYKKKSYLKYGIDLEKGIEYEERKKLNIEFFNNLIYGSRAYGCIADWGEYDNHDILLNFCDIGEDNSLRIGFQRYLEEIYIYDDKAFQDDFLSFFWKEKYNIPTYKFFCENLTGDFYNRLVKYLERRVEKPKWHLEGVTNPNNRKIEDISDLTITFNCNFKESYDYAKQEYNYTDVTAKMDNYSKEILKDFLIKKGFPYEKNYQEYIRLLQNMDYNIKVFIKKHYTVFKYHLNDIFTKYVPSNIKPNQFINHTHIVGRSGSGKSEFLKTIIKQVGKSCILLDPHGDIADSLDKKENFFKIAPTESRFVINPFDIEDKSIDNRELVAEEIIQLLQEIIQDSNVSVLMKTISFPIISTLLKLPYADFRMFSECINPLSGVDILEDLTPYVDDHLKKLWEDLKTDAYDSTKRSVFNRLQSFLNKSKIINTVCGYDDFLPTIERVEQGENLVISLPIPQLGEDVAEVLGRFFMCRMQIWAKRRQNLEQHQRKPIVLIVDECQNFLSQETAKTLDQFGRKFGLYMILAHQHINQIDGRGLKGSILANCKNKIVGYCDESTARTMSGAMKNTQAEDFQDLKKGHFWGVFEDQEPLKFYARRALFLDDLDDERTKYAPTKNADYVDGWELAKIKKKPTAPSSQFKPKFDL